MSISPWQSDAEVPSPDGRLVARIVDAGEIAMGGPTSGTLMLSNGLARAGCSPSMVWSDDSRHLAIPEWTRDRMQSLLVIDTRTGKTLRAPREYRVLELESFTGGVIRGIDSPIHQPTPVEVSLDSLAGRPERGTEREKAWWEFWK